MALSEWLTPEGVFADLKASSKKQVLQQLSSHAADICGGDEREILDALLERERLGTTGVGHGIAIPHAKLAGLARLHALFARLEHPVEFDAVDEDPVDLVFLLLAPHSDGAAHLKALARVSRLLRDEEMCAKLRGSEGADAMYALLEGSIAQAA